MKRLLVLAALLLPLYAQAAPLARQAALAIPVAPAAYPLPGAAALINMFTAPQNAFSNAAWTKTHVQDTTFATKTAAPDGTQTASKFIEDTVANQFHIIAQSVVRSSAPIAGVPFRLVVDAKEAGRNIIFVQVYDGPKTSGVFSSFDLRTGTLSGATSTAGGFTALATTIVPIGNGFYRATLDFTSNNDPTLLLNIVLDNGGGTGQYTGNGASGVFLWQASLLPRTAWSLGRRTFSDDFTYLSPDKSNSQGPGFKWYVGNWPSAVHDPGDAWRTFTVTTAADLSAAASVLTIATDRSTFGANIQTAAASGAGQSFGPPALFRCSISFNPANQLLADVSWPACWTISLEFLNGAATNNISAGVSEFMEYDILEGEPTANAVIADDVTIHDWKITGSGSAFGSNTNTNYDMTTNWPFVQSGWNSGQHVVAALWLSAASNSGIGMGQSYVDGIFVQNSEVSWTAGAGANPGGTPANPNGNLIIGDAQHLVLLLAAGPSRPILIDFADVWQR